jgi:hypothetical protein
MIVVHLSLLPHKISFSLPFLCPLLPHGIVDAEREKTVAEAREREKNYFEKERERERNLKGGK